METGKQNEPLSALTHGIGAGLSIAALVLMVIWGAIYGRVEHVVGFAIFGASLIILYTTSTVYHALPQSTRAKQIWRKLDHAMIFILIAGTYTPICLAMPSRGWGWAIFGVIWGLAFFGFALKMTVQHVRSSVSVPMYLLMGWLLIIALSPMRNWFTDPWAFFWLVCGGVWYSVGCIFYALDKKIRRTRWFGMHEVFHLCVLLGSFSHFWLMLRYVAHL